MRSFPPSRKIRSLTLVALFLVVAVAGFGAPASEIERWSVGLDISVLSITSHSNNSTVVMQPQTFTAMFENSGTLNFTSNLSAVLNIHYPATGPGQSEVFNDTQTLDNLSEPGNRTNATFSDWNPSFPGSFRVTVSHNGSDDHSSNDTLLIILNIVDSAEYGVQVVIEGDSDKVMPPGSDTKHAPYTPFEFTVRNTGIHIDSFNISIDSDWVMPGYPTVVGPLDPGERSAIINVDAAVPSTASGGDWDRLKFTAASQGDITVKHSVHVYINTTEKPGISVTATPDLQKAYPGGDWIHFTFFVTNVGNFVDSYMLEVIPNPSNWEVLLDSIPYINSLSPGSTTAVHTRLRIPELDYDTMIDDLTYRGASGALVLQVESPLTHVQASAQGNVEVGLIHTVQMEMSPSNVTVPWIPDESQDVLFELSLRAVDNVLGGGGQDMTVELNLTEGPNGVEFIPVWVLEPNETESRRWAAYLADPEPVNLTGGEWDEGNMLKVIVPRFPYDGRGVTTIVATPLLNTSIEGLVIPKTANATVFVSSFLDFELKPPEEDVIEARPGETVKVEFNVTNMGNTWDAYRGQATYIPIEPAVTNPEEWVIKYPYGQTVGPLIPFWFDPMNGDHSMAFVLSVRVPDGTPIGEQANITLRMVSATNESIERRGYVTITALQGFGLDLEPEESQKTAGPGDVVAYRLNLTNTGNGPDSVDIEYYSVTDLSGWNITLEISGGLPIELDPLEHTTFTILVEPSWNASANDLVAIRVRAASSGNSDVYDDVYLNTTIRYIAGIKFTIQGPGEIWRQPGEIATFLVEMANIGNGDDTFTITGVMGNDNWMLSLDLGSGEIGSGTSFDLPRGTTRSVRVNITLPPISRAEDMEDLEELSILAGTKVINHLVAEARNDPLAFSEINLTVGVLQEHRASLRLDMSDMAIKEVLVGESVTFNLLLGNLGNREDRLVVKVQGTSRHISWIQDILDIEGSRDLLPFQDVPINVTILPSPADRPRYHELVPIFLNAQAGDNVTYRRVNITARIVMSRLITPTLEVDLGTTGTIRLRLCNMPDPGEEPIPSFPLRKSYAIRSELSTEGFFSQHWNLPQKVINITLEEAYELTTVEIPIRAPDDLLYGSEFSRIEIGIQGDGGKCEERTLTARGVYFDAAILQHGVSLINLYEGETGRAVICIVTEGNRGQDNISVLVMVDGEVLGIFEAGPAVPYQYADGRQELPPVIVEFDLPNLRWYEKGKEMDIEIVIDPDGVIVENKYQGKGDSEENNRYREGFVIKNYTPSPIFLILTGLLLMLGAIGGIIGFFFLDRRNSWYLLLLSAGFVGLFALLFYVPLEESTSLTVANNVGAAVIFIDLLVVLPLMLFLFSRAGDAYIRHLINRDREGEIEEGREMTGTLWKPIAISVLGGLFSIVAPLAIWTLPEVVGQGTVTISDVLTSDDIILPLWILIVASPLLSLGIQMILVLLKRGSLKRIRGTREDLERLKNEIEEGFS